MITNINRFKKQLMNENFDFGNVPTEDFENEVVDSENEMEDNDDSENDNDDEVQEEGFTLDSFTQMVSDEINKLNAEREEAGEEEAMIDQLTKDQLAVVFGLVSPMCNTESVQEGFFGDVKDFLKGGSKEELAKKEEEAKNRVQEILTKFKDKEIKLQEYADNKTVPFTEESALAMAKKNNFLGIFQTFDKGNFVIALYKPGQKGLAKLSSGGSSAGLGV